MLGDAANSSTVPEMSAALPPVYTYWGEEAPPVTAATEPVAPYFAVMPGDDLREDPPITGTTPEAHPIPEPMLPEPAMSEPAFSAPMLPDPVLPDPVLPDPAQPEPMLSEQSTPGPTVEESRVPEPQVLEPMATPAEEVDAGHSVRGREVVSISPASAAAHDLAERLETIARRLRTDGTAAVVAGMRGDRFDALLAGLFAGYLAAREPDN